MLKEKIEEAEYILTHFGSPGVLQDSGGKDSTVLKGIAEGLRKRTGYQYEIVHNHTTIDAPETVYFVRDEKKRAEADGIKYTINYPELTFEKLCLKKGMLPTRLVRFCCKALKEGYSPDRGNRVVTGVRRSESTQRKKNQGIVTMLSAKETKEGAIDGVNFSRTDKLGVVLLNYDNDENAEAIKTCFRTNKILVNPLINWNDDDVWKYIRDNKLSYNPLYDRGWLRVGCVGCPMASRHVRLFEFSQYPKFKERFIRIADMIVAKTKAKKGKDYNGSKSGLAYFKRWMEDDNVDGQLTLNPDGSITEDYT